MHTSQPDRSGGYIQGGWPKLYERIQAAKQNSKPQPESTQIDLFFPPWVDSVRGVPNVALRSALFGAIKKGARAYLERQEIHAQEGVRIMYTGARLDQGDLDVWETVLHAVRQVKLGDECKVTAYRLLKMMGKTDTGMNRDTLDRRLSRMKATAIDVLVGRYAYEGSLIDEVLRDKQTRQYVIRLNPKLISLFGADQFTKVDWMVRQGLQGKPLAQWLHGYYATHAKPFPVKTATLLRLSGSESELRRYRQTLGDALNALAEVSVAHGARFNYQIRDDVVHVQKQASGPQRRHLARKASKSRKPRN